MNKFLERATDAKVLTKLSDISEFIQKSVESLEHISRAKGFDKAETEVDPSMRPLSLHVQKVFDLITKFNMFPPNQA